MDIAPKSLIKDILKEYPGSKKVLAKHGMMCMECKGIEHETLKNAAKNHGVSLKGLISELEKHAKKGK